MALFSSAFDTTRNCDAYLVDSERAGRLFVLDTDAPGVAIVDEVLERTVLMSRNLHLTRGESFALFAGEAPGAFTLAVTDPVETATYSMLKDVLRSFGRVAREAEVRLDDAELTPLVAYEEGTVSFFDTAETRAWREPAGKRGLRMLSCTTSHDPDPDVEVR